MVSSAGIRVGIYRRGGSKRAYGEIGQIKGGIFYIQAPCPQLCQVEGKRVALRTSSRQRQEKRPRLCGERRFRRKRFGASATHVIDVVDNSSDAPFCTDVIDHTAQ
jgi:hypothetical protein